MNPPPGLRERKKQKTRWAIQEHAVRLFAQQGFEATTVEQIAEAAEISPSTFFRYFKTKEDVVHEDRYDDLIAAAIEAAPPELDPLSTMRHALRTAMSDLEPAEWAQVRERMRLTLSVPSLRARATNNLLGSAEAFAPSLARRLGRDPDDFALRAFVTACMAAAAIAVVTWFNAGDTDAENVPDVADLTDRALAALADLSH